MKVFFQRYTSVLLMSLSIFLLSAFQVIWLKKLYQEQYDLLQKETDNVFFRTIRGMQDSLIREVILQPAGLKRETDGQEPPEAFSRMGSAVFITKDSGRVQTDSFSVRKIRVSVSPHEKQPSEEGLLSSIVFQFQTANESDSLFDLGHDSLRIFGIRQQFNRALLESGIDLPFEVQRFRSSDSVHHIAMLVTRPIMADLPMENQYVAGFPKIRWYLLKKLIPQAVFSLSLLLLVTLSFVLIYRNMQKQKRLSELKSDLISNITHELKTPITTVGVALEALQNFSGLENPERTKEYLDISRNELNRLSILVDKVLKMSIFENKEPQLKLERFNLKTLTTEILNSMKLQFDRQEARVEFDCPDSDFFLEGDRIHLTNVLYNLLDNALKYSPDHPDIRIGLSAQNRHIIWSVADNGVGIPAEYREKIFEKFFRVPSGGRHNTKGHGLGLSYVAGVIRKHQGTIRVDSQEGKGSCFILSLPKTQKNGAN